MLLRVFLAQFTERYADSPVPGESLIALARVAALVVDAGRVAMTQRGPLFALVPV